MTGIQQEIKFAPPKSIRLLVLEAMSGPDGRSSGMWWRLEELVAYCRRYGKWTSDATISARLRELKAQGYPHETRPRGKGSNAVEYRRVA